MGLYTELENDLRALRHDLHRHPEIGFDLDYTRGEVRKWLERCPPSQIIEPGGGILASYWPEDLSQEDQNKGLLIRVDMDALPIDDKSGSEYASEVEGRGHQCGHDGHTVIGCAVAAAVHYIAQEGHLNQAVHIIFQPSEENGQGAKAVLDDPLFDLEPDHVVALHNIPGAPLGSILSKPNDFTPHVISVDIELMGAEAHAAQPDTGILPHRAVQEIIGYFDGLHKQKIKDRIAKNDFVVAPIFIEMGERAYGTAAGQASMGYTVRSRQSDTLDQRIEEITDALENIAKRHKLKVHCRWHEAFEANHNDPATVTALEQAWQMTDLKVKSLDKVFSWGEDFGCFSQRFRGAMFGLGAGEDCPPLHRPEYDFPDSSIKPGYISFTSFIISQTGLTAELQSKLLRSLS